MTEETKQKLYSIALRFGKAFVSGGVATMSLLVVSAPSVATFEDFGKWLLALGVGFVTGGIMAAEKYLSWQP